MSSLNRWPSLHSIVANAGHQNPFWAAECSLARIQALDSELGGFISVSDLDNIKVVKKESRKQKQNLLGVPIGIKDNIAVRGLPMTCGSRVLNGFMPPSDATVIERLRNAGALIVGKTNMDEFAMGSSTETSAFKQCRNPWNTKHVPGGSSGGSAAAVAAGLVPIALGSDTGGSVRQPAAFCGLVGFKPSYGAVSRFGLVAYGSSLDQIGILGTRVTDVESIFDIIRGPDGRDDTVLETSMKSKKTEPRPHPVVGVIKEYNEHPALDRTSANALKRTIEECLAAGAEIVELSLPSLDQIVVPAYYLTACAEASSNLGRFDGIRYGVRKGDETGSVDDIVRASRALFGSEVKLRILLGTYVLRSGHYEYYYGRAQVARRQITRDLTKAFKNVDFLLTPATPTQAFMLGELIKDPIQMKLADLFTVTANLAGLPAISIPVDLVNGLPTSVQFMAPRHSDAMLLSFSNKIEERLNFDPSECSFCKLSPTIATGEPYEI